MKIKVRIKGEWQELQLPDGAEIQEVKIETPAMITYFEPQNKKAWRTGKVHTVIHPNKLEDTHNTPDVTLCVGDWSDSQECFIWRSDAMLYIHGYKIIGKNQVPGSGYAEKTIVPKPWKNRNYDPKLDE